MKHSTTFIPNEPDNMHCFQACYRMAIQSLTGELPSWEQAEVATGFEDGLNTWPHAGMLAAADAGLWVKTIEVFDAEGFAEDPLREVTRLTGNSDLAKNILETSTDTELERTRVKKCIAHERILLTNRAPDRSDVVHFAGLNNATVICNINDKTLRGVEGYVGHFVLIVAADDTGVTLHNPGLPGRPNQFVNWDLFMGAWAPEPNYANLIVLSKDKL